MQCGVVISTGRHLRICPRHQVDPSKHVTIMTMKCTKLTCNCAHLAPDFFLVHKMCCVCGIFTLYLSFFLVLCHYSRTPLHLDGGLNQIFPNFMPLSLAKYGVTIICRYSKDMNFHKIWRV